MPERYYRAPSARTDDRHLIQEQLADIGLLDQESYHSRAVDAFRLMLQTSSTDEVIKKIRLLGGVEQDSELRKIFDEHLFHKLLQGNSVEVSSMIDGLSYTFRFPVCAFKRHFQNIFQPLHATNVEREATIDWADANRKKRLESLVALPVDQAIEEILFSGDVRKIAYLASRLSNYQEFLDPENPHANPNADQSSIERGLRRDVLFAAMTGTPEMAMYRISLRKCRAQKIGGIGSSFGGKAAQLPTHFPLLKGFHSGIQEGKIGDYNELFELYLHAHSSVASKANEEISAESLEFRAVNLAADWLTEAMKYNDPLRSPHSSYVTSLEEALTWARLGDPYLKKQLAGMRRKIQGADLHMIRRFIGKSGASEQQERNRRRINTLSETLNLLGDEETLAGSFGKDVRKEAHLASHDVDVRGETEKTDEETRPAIAHEVVQVKLLQTAFGEQSSRFLTWDKHKIEKHRMVEFLKNSPEFLDEVSKISMKELEIDLATGIREAKRELEKKLKGIALQYANDYYNVGEHSAQSATDVYQTLCDKYEQDFADALPEVLFGQAKRVFVENQNKHDIKRLEERFFASIPEEISSKYQADIETAQNAEQRLEISRITHRYHESLLRSPEGLLMQREKQRLLERTAAGLWTETRRERDHLEAIYEGKKSLGQKAVDLHWRYAKTPYGGAIDWINTAPFGSIERSHKALRSGVDEETAFALAFGERMFYGADMPHTLLNRLSKILGVLPSNDLKRLEEFYKEKLLLPQDNVASKKIDPWEVKQKAFLAACLKMRNTLIEEYKFEELETFGNAVGLVIDFRSPELYPVVIQATKNNLTHNPCYLFDVTNVIIRGVGFNPIQESEELQERLIFLIRQGLEAADIETIKNLQALLGVPVDFSGSMANEVHSCYAKVLESAPDDKMFKEMEDVKTLTGVRPEFTGSNVRRAVFVRYIKWVVHLNDSGYGHGAGPQAKIAQLERITGINRASILENADGWTALVLSVNTVAAYKKNVEFITTTQSSQMYSEETRKTLMEEGLQAAYGRLIKNRRFSYISEFPYISELVTEYGILPAQGVLREAAFAELAGNGLLSDGLSALLLKCKVKLECTPEDIAQFTSLRPSAWAVLYTIGLPKDARTKKKVISRAEAAAPVAALMPELLSIKGPAARPEFCPWRTQMDPLVETINIEHPLGEAANRFGLIEFVRRFGMVNLPCLASVVIDLQGLKDRLSKKDNLSDQLPLSTRTELNALYQANGRVLDWQVLKTIEGVNSVLNYLEQVLDTLKQDIVQDRIPDGVEQTALGMELFNSVVIRSGHYGNLDDRRRIILQWRSVERTQGKTATSVPPYYPKGSRKITIKTQSPKTGLDDVTTMLEGGVIEAEAFEKRSNAIQKLEQDKQNLLKQEILRNFLAPFHGELGALSSIDVSRPLAIVERPLVRLSREIAEIESNLLTLQVTASSDEKQAVLQEKKKKGMEMALARLREKMIMFSSMSSEENLMSILESASIKLGTNEEGSESSHSLDQLKQLLGASSLEKMDSYTLTQILLETLLAKFGNELLQVAKSEVYLLVLKLVSLESPGHIEAIRRELHGSREGVSEKLLDAWSDWFTEEGLLHFTDPKNTHQSIRRVPFSKNLLKLIEKIFEIHGQRSGLLEMWNRGVLDKPVKHPLASIDLNVRELDQKIERIKSEKNVLSESDSKMKKVETMDINYYSCHGLGRIFAGDIASACYDKQREALAKNEYPDLQAVLMTHEEGKTIEMLGSCLLIEAITVDGKKAIVIRALNPTDAVINRRLDASDVVLKTVEYATEIARAGKKDMVLLCDGPGHQSNRAPIITAISALAIQKKWPHGPELKSTKETNFNGYNIGASGQTRLVWSVKSRND